MTMIKISGGDGSTQEDAVIILNARDETEGVDAEYNYLDDTLGKENVCWKLVFQHLIDDGDKQYDILNIIFTNGEIINMWFNISDFYGK